MFYSWGSCGPAPSIVLTAHTCLVSSCLPLESTVVPSPFYSWGDRGWEVNHQFLAAELAPEVPGPSAQSLALSLMPPCSHVFPSPHAAGRWGWGGTLVREEGVSETKAGRSVLWIPVLPSHRPAHPATFSTSVSNPVQNPKI